MHAAGVHAAFESDRCCRGANLALSHQAVPDHSYLIVKTELATIGELHKVLKRMHYHWK